MSQVCWWQKLNSLAVKKERERKKYGEENGFKTSLRIFAVGKLVAVQSRIYCQASYSAADECFACLVVDFESSAKKSCLLNLSSVYLILSFRLILLLLLDSYPLGWRFLSFSSRTSLSFCFILFSFLVREKFAFGINYRAIAKRVLWKTVVKIDWFSLLPSGISSFSLK